MREKREMGHVPALQLHGGWVPHIEEMICLICGSRERGTLKTETGEDSFSPARLRTDIFWIQRPPWPTSGCAAVAHRRRPYSAMAYSAAASA